MTSLQFFKGFSVHRASTMNESADWILHMAEKIGREFAKGKIPYYLSNAYLGNRRTISNSEEAKQSSENILFPFSNMSPTTAPVPEPCMNASVAVTELSGADYCTVVKKVKKDNVTPENIGEIILCQIPGISSVTAIAIMKHFKTFPNLIEELQKNAQCIENMTIEANGKTRKINKTSLENIRKYLLQPNDNTSA